ncbi:IS66 family transposase [Candidatus Woesearchaeota archaeon]|nr:IS66 family transposase [Candidatus Woesearchaeota archaeon]
MKRFLKAKIEELEHRLLAYENAHTPPSLTLKKPPRKEANGKLGAKEGHPKWERKEPEPTGSVEYIEEACPKCDTKLGKPFKTERVIEEEIPEPQPVEVIEHLINHYECPKCHKHVVAKHNAPKGRFGKNVQAHVTLLKFDDRLPLRKVVSSLERHYGLTLSNVGVFQITRQVAGKLETSYQALIQHVRNARVVYCDETKIRVDSITFWLWTFTTEQETLFVIRKSRAKKVVEEVLGENFRGVITCDGWTAYAQYPALIQRCWAHLLREIKKLNEMYDGVQGFYDSFKKIFEQIRQVRTKPPSFEIRQALFMQLREEMQELVKQMNVYTQLRKFAGKVKNGLDYWFTCIIHLFVEPTNNTAERALRELIVQRKIIGGLRREKGARIMETIASMIATWKQQQLPLFTTLKSHL